MLLSIKIDNVIHTGRLVRENFDWHPRHTFPPSIAVFFHSIFISFDLCCFFTARNINNNEKKKIIKIKYHGLLRQTLIHLWYLICHQIRSQTSSLPSCPRSLSSKMTKNRNCRNQIRFCDEGFAGEPGELAILWILPILFLHVFSALASLLSIILF